MPLFVLGSEAAIAADCNPGSVSDFNGDGKGDIAIGDPGAGVGGRAGAGYVVVKYGSLGSGPTVTITQSSAGVGETSQAGDEFGAKIAIGCLDSDSCADLIVGAPGEDLATSAS